MNRVRHAVTRRVSLAWDYLTTVIPRQTPPYLRNWLRSGRYPQLTELELMASRKSDTAFLFGSGYSINDIDTATWDHISGHDTISFREFPRQDFVRADYHLTAEVDDLESYARTIRENPRYSRTVFVVQTGWYAYNGNDLIGKGLLNPDSRVFRFRRTGRGIYQPPNTRFADGLVHGFSSAISSTNFAIAMEWKQIVLAGIDLYDKRYFWLEHDEMREYEKPGLSIDSSFTNSDRIVDYFRRWREWCDLNGIRLTTLNPRSLLADVMPVYEVPSRPA